MRVVISAGGTGGHIYPALAIINKIKDNEPNSEFLYIGTHNRMEKDIIPNYGLPYMALEIYGFNRHNLFANFKVIKCLLISYFKAKKAIKKFKPDIVIGVGGYVTGPVLLAGKRLHFKTVVHEQNSVPGLSNKLLSKFVDKILVSFASSIKHFPPKKTIFTGNPCSEAALDSVMVPKSEYGLSNDKKLVLIVMGSLGSSKISEILIKTLPMFKNKNYEVLFVTGKGTYDMVKEGIYPDNVKIVPYIDNNTGFMKNADLIVTRCGASILSEIIALEKPSILIPSPYVPNNHQYKNGMDLIDLEAAIMIEEKNLDGLTLVKTIDDLINNEEALIKMRAGLYKMRFPHSATKIYEIIKGMVNNDGKRA